MPSLILEDIKSKVTELALPLLAKADVDLIEIKVKGNPKDLYIEVTADKPLGGITIEECSTLNRSLAQAIDAAGFIPEESYSLEFSSAGLDRPLKTYKDFLRNLNADIHFYFVDAVEGKKEMDGLLIAANSQMLTIMNKKKQEIVIPLENISRGMLII